MDLNTVYGEWSQHRRVNQQRFLSLRSKIKCRYYDRKLGTWLDFSLVGLFGYYPEHYSQNLKREKHSRKTRNHRKVNTDRYRTSKVTKTTTWPMPRYYSELAVDESDDCRSPKCYLISNKKMSWDRQNSPKFRMIKS